MVFNHRFAWIRGQPAMPACPPGSRHRRRSWFSGGRGICAGGGGGGGGHVTTSTAVLFTFVLIVDIASTSPLHYCHRLDPSPRRLYATKTSYDDVRSHQRDSDPDMGSSNGAEGRTQALTQLFIQENGDASLVRCHDGAPVVRIVTRPDGHNSTVVANGFCHRPDGNSQSQDTSDKCEPVSLYLLARHGTRFNKFSSMNEMVERLESIRGLIKEHSTKGTMCQEDLDWLYNWKARHLPQDGSRLSPAGWSEMFGIGYRYQKLYPTILGQHFSKLRYEFRFTNYSGRGERTRESARAFAQGLWGTDENIVMVENGRPDWLLQFYEYCQKYLRVVASQPVEEYEKFKAGSEMTEVISSVNTRLGLSPNTLGFDDVYLMFENCRLEHGLYRDAPWCSVLAPWMLEVIEYHQDIKYHFEDSYGQTISYTPACTIVGDIVNHLTSDTKLGLFRFAHSGTLDAFYTRIGLYRDDETLRADNFDRHRYRRQWATSRSTPMAANIAFVKYRCETPPFQRVRMIVNEHRNNPQVFIPGCQGQSLCPLETLLASWVPIADDCDIDEMCEQVDQSTSAFDGR